jgi:hypothetical protein
MLASAAAAEGLLISPEVLNDQKPTGPTYYALVHPARNRSREDKGKSSRNSKELQAYLYQYHNVDKVDATRYTRLHCGS